MGMELLTTHYTNYISKMKHSTEMKLDLSKKLKLKKLIERNIN